MKRAIVCALLATFVVGMFAFAGEAQRRRRPRGRARPVPAEAPRSEEISTALGEVRWGMTKDQLLTLLTGKIRERYRPLMSKATDAITEDRHRHDMEQEVQRLTQSFVRFNGRRSGWDVSFLQDEFTHNNNESMLVQNDENSQNFYLFINDRLWKWYKAFNADVFEGQTFEQFATALQGRFGPALEKQQEVVVGRGERHWLEWQDESTRLRAIDQTRFYGFYCLVFEEKETVANLATLRRNTSATKNNANSLVDRMTSGEGETNNPDTSPDIVDRLTGKVRNNQDHNPPPNAQKQPARPTKQGAAPAPTPARPGSDPLRGMDL